MKPLIIEGSKIKDKESAHDVIASSLGFPAWYGRNLDALSDCLSELPADACVILLDSAQMKKNLGEYADRLIEVFEDAAAAPGGCGFVVCTDEN